MNMDEEFEKLEVPSLKALDAIDKKFHKQHRESLFPIIAAPVFIVISWAVDNQNISLAAMATAYICLMVSLYMMSRYTRTMGEMEGFCNGITASMDDFKAIKAFKEKHQVDGTGVPVEYDERPLKDVEF